MDWSLLGFKGLGEVLNTHPVFVHFPIALIPTAFFFYLIGLVRKRKDLLLAGQISLALGLAGIIVSVLTGYFAQETFPHGEVIHHMMETHQTLGYAILAVGVFLMIWSFWKHEGTPRAPKIFLVLLGFTVLMILQNADLGGRMVFVEGAAVKAMPSSQEEHHHHDHGESAPQENEEAPHEHHDHGHDHHH